MNRKFQFNLSSVLCAWSEISDVI